METENIQKVSFIQSLYTNADHYFQTKPSGKYGNLLFYLKSFFFLLLYVAAYYSFLFRSDSLPMLLWAAVLLGFCHVLIPVNIAHDAIHKTLSRHAWINSLGCFGLEITGASSYMYGKKHVEAHFNKENGSKASSIESQGMLLQVKKDKATVNLPYSFYAFYAQYMIFVRDFVLFYKSSDKIPVQEFAKLVVSKIAYSIAFLVLPFVFIPAPWWQVVLALLLMYFIVTALLVIILLMPTEKMQHSKMSGKYTYNERWVIEILEHNVDFSPESRLLNCVAGGTNLNVVHYFFPDVNHVHYNHLAEIIQETAEAYGLLYRKQGVRDVFGIHLNYLKNIQHSPTELSASSK